MARFLKKSLKKAGSPPGTLVHVGEIKADRSSVAVLHYNADTLVEQSVAKIIDALDLSASEATTWINVEGLHDISVMEEVGRQYGVNVLTLEDILNTTQRPKAEVFDNYIFVAIKMLGYDEEKESISSEQVSLVLGKKVLVTFQEGPGDVFEPVRERIRKGNPQMRTGGCGYLAYALIDAVVDNYYLILEELGRRIEVVEENIDADEDENILDEIHDIRRELIYLRKQVWPLREIITHLTRDGAPFIREKEGPFLRDVYDHTIQTIDTIESFRDILTAAQDLYLSTISNRMNEVMKVLTIISTIFIPLSFITGLYGMNFANMPELGWRWGYPAIWLLIVAVVLGMLIFFRRKKWL